MELPGPEQRVTEEKRSYFVASVIEDQRAPILLLALAWVGMLVQCGAVELGERVAIFREMPWHPVEDDPEAVAMALIDEVPEIVWGAKATRRREEPDHLIPPRPGERVLHDRHQLDVRVTHLAHVRHERLR